MALHSLSTSSLKRRHSELCFQRAFPRSSEILRDAVSELASFSCDIDDSGIAGGPVFYRFSFDVAKWLARRAPGAVSIDWSELDDTESLDTLLRHILRPAEDEYFDSGDVGTQDWIDIARAGSDGTDFDWLMAQLQEKQFQTFYRQLYDAADVPLTWELGDSRFSKSHNVFGKHRTHIRSEGMRGRPGQAKKEIARPVESITRLSGKRGEEMVDVAIASLAVRHRETYHFNFANPDEVYVADVGRGIEVAVFGLLPDYRFPLECTMGFLLLSNGVPIGYGGSSVLFKQVNTGLNVFDEYRGSEAAYLWVQVMRVYHSLVGCQRFIANPYQLGGDNTEALKSGAFWFYYKLGYRPVDTDIRRLAVAEQAKTQRHRDYRSDLKTLRKLASGDMHLTLSGARQRDLFDEQWLSTSSGLASRTLGLSAGRARQTASNRIVGKVLKAMGVKSTRAWSKAEKRGLQALAPFVAAIDTSSWSGTQKRDTRRLLRAKGGSKELDYARLIASNDQFLQALRSACIAASRDCSL